MSRATRGVSRGSCPLVGPEAKFATRIFALYRDVKNAVTGFPTGEDERQNTVTDVAPLDPSPLGNAGWINARAL